MNTSQDTNAQPTLFTFYDLQTSAVKDWGQGVTKELMTSFLTIRDYWKQLYDVEIDFTFKDAQDYIWKVMRVDFNTIVKHLNEYDGPVRGVKEAKKKMEDATIALHGIWGTFDETFPQLPSERLKARAAEATACRALIEEAYLLLQNLEPEAIQLELLLKPDEDTDSNSVDKPAS